MHKKGIVKCKTAWRSKRNYLGSRANIKITKKK